MIMLAVMAVTLGAVILILLVGYAIGRAEAAEQYEWQIDELQQTIDALTAPHLTVLD